MEYSLINDDASLAYIPFARFFSQPQSSGFHDWLLNFLARYWYLVKRTKIIILLRIIFSDWNIKYINKFNLISVNVANFSSGHPDAWVMCYDAIALWCSNLKQLNDVDVGNRRETKIVLRKLKKIVFLVNISSYSIFTLHSFGSHANLISSIG